MAPETGTAARRTKPACAVLMTLYRTDDIGQFEDAVRSIETQDIVDADIRIYLCLDGRLTPDQEHWLRVNGARFHKITRNIDNLGLARSLNKLIGLLGDEDLVFRMDGDDLSTPDRFRKQAAYLEANPGIDMIGCQARDMDDDGRLTGERRFETAPDRVADLLYRMTPVLHPTFCIRRKILGNPALRYPDAYLTADLAFLVTLAEHGHRIGNHPEMLFHWRTGAKFFERRRSVRRGYVELLWFTRALWLRRGYLTTGYIYPISRLVLRCLPAGIVKRLYHTGLREKVITTARPAVPKTANPHD